MATKPLDFHKGLNTGADHISCPDGYAITLSDWKLEYGYMRPRYGTTVVNASPPLVSGHLVEHIYHYIDDTNINGGNPSCVFVVTSAKIFRAYYTTDAAWQVANNITFTDVTGTSGTSFGPASADVLNNILMLFGQGAPTQITAYNVNAAPLAGSPPSVTAVKVVNNFAFAAVSYWNSGSTLNTVYWSNVGDPQTWSAANFLKYRTSDGDFVTGLGVINQDLLIFKNNHIGRLSTQTSVTAGVVTLGPLYTLIDGVGCPYQNAIDNLPNGNCVFLGGDFNVYQTDGVSVRILSKNPYPGTDVYRGGTPGLGGGAGSGLGNYGVNLDVAANIQPWLRVFSTQNEIWITFPYSNSSVGNAYLGGDIIIYDYVQDYWRKATGYSVMALCPLNITRGARVAGAGAFQQPTRLLGGSALSSSNDANVYFLENELQTTVKSYLGTTTPAVMTLTCPTPESLSGEDFRSLVAQSSNSGSTSVYFGFDGTLNSAATATLSASYVRNVITIPYPAQNSNVRYASLQVSFQDSNSANKIYIPYLSTEVSS